MTRMIIALFVCFFSIVGFSMPTSCPPASSTGTPNFCSSFKMAAECYCTSSGLPRGMCGNMEQLYNRMISMFGSLQRACEFQHNTTAQICVDDWNCYRFGGVNSQSEACSTTGKSCV